MGNEPFTFGQWLRAQLDEEGLSQADLAREASVGTNTVSYWVNGQRVPDPASCEKIASALKIDADIVLANAGHRPLRQPIELYELRDLMRDRASLDERERRIIDTLRGREVSVLLGPRMPADTVRWSAAMEQQEMVDVLEAYLGGRPPHSCFVAIASGNCLTRRGIVDGGRVLCERLTPGQQPANGNVVVIRVGDEWTLKVWHREGDWITLRDGDDHPITHFSIADDFEIEGIVFLALPHPV